MSWYYPYWYFPTYMPYFIPYDIFTLMSMMMWWMIIPYYYSLYFEFFKMALEAWRKAFESMTKTITTTPT